MIYTTDRGFEWAAEALPECRIDGCGKRAFVDRLCNFHMDMMHQAILRESLMAQQQLIQENWVEASVNARRQRRILARTI